MTVRTKTSASRATKIAHDAYPKGPEALAQRLNVQVVYAPMENRLGWCVAADHGIRIRINTGATKTRQRFTLARELAHVVLGTEPDLVAWGDVPFGSNRREEREADKLASDFLLPQPRVAELISDATIDRTIVKNVQQAGTLDTRRKKASFTERCVLCGA
jgi:Zn-dependent peptidase ImmA (M78 family)